MDLVWIYTYFSVDYADEDVPKHLYSMAEERENSQDVENLLSNLLEVHSNMRYLVKDNLTNVLAPLIQIPAPTKYHYRFALFLDPNYVMEFKDINTFHQSENVDTKTLSQQIMPKLYECIID